MSSVTVGPPTGDGELIALVETHGRTYARSPQDGEAWLKRLDPADVRVVRSGGRVAGGLVLIRMGQWFGGQAVPMTGIGSVGVDPQHRSSGLASALMRAVLDELHTSGAALSALYPATQPVYRRVGYELAGSWIVHRMAAQTIDVRDRELGVRRVTEADGTSLRALYTERARRTSGNLDRNERMWERVMHSEIEPAHAYVVERNGSPEGYAVFEQARDGSWKYDLRVRDLVALTPAAARRLWALFADHRSFAKDVVWVSGPADPVVYPLREQLWTVDRAWTWMLRVVDVRGALGSRGYPAGLEAEIHLEIRDDVCGWNDGRFVLEVTGGAGKVRKGGRGRLRVDVRGLAGLYTGFMGPRELIATGLAEGAERDMALAQAIFAGPAPWLPDFF